MATIEAAVLPYSARIPQKTSATAKMVVVWERAAESARNIVALGKDAAAASTGGERTTSGLPLNASGLTVDCTATLARRTPRSDSKTDRSNNCRMGVPCLPQIADQHRPDDIRHRFRQTLPQRNQCPIPWIQRIVLRHFLTA